MPKVVFYHDIGTKYTPMGTNLKIFKKHLKILEEVDHLICFDDGFRGIFENREMLKEVEKRGGGGQRRIKVFIAVGLVGNPGYLAWDEIRVLQKDYGIDFQSHTWSHQTLVGPWNEDDVPREPRTEAWYTRELVESREKIAAELGKEVDELCFPVGYFSDGLIARCKAAGYKKVYASYPGNITEDYVQPRCLAQDLGILGFRALLNGGLMVFRNRYYAAHVFTDEEV